MVPIDPVSTGISLLAICAFIFPILRACIRQKAQRALQRAAFLNEAKTRDLHLSQTDFWRGQYGIGLDTANQTVVYYNTSSEPTIQCISLPDIREVRFHKTSHLTGRGRSREEIVDRLEIHLLGEPAVFPCFSLVFFDGDKHSDLCGEWPLAKKWEQLLRNAIAGI
ncbi:hypothetical protein SAMN05192553_106157 [Cyclobacterium xiamenense]|uniref:Uncharacterized protein n=1 Tax=Cyclobacterium xiamenense TaxID=1297121 RepID=A0A1H7AL52_9BACT|nr:hypothetical protein [Cyclobacterium xiamenense]SEJ62600.1 hypothetical protein SAMN05192553_106157 [Cyclobacterium xiamenense]